jgi:hypothetical protein
MAVYNAREEVQHKAYPDLEPVFLKTTPITAYSRSHAIEAQIVLPLSGHSAQSGTFIFVTISFAPHL